MERQFFGKSFRKCGQPPEVVHFSVRNGNREIRLPFKRIVSFPGPFSQDRVNMQDGMLGGKWEASFSSDWSINLENRLP